MQWVNLITSLLGDVKNWILGIVLSLALVRIGYEGLRYKGGTEDERMAAGKSIRNTSIWLVGLPFALWLAATIWTRAQGIS